MIRIRQVDMTHPDRRAEVVALHLECFIQRELDQTLFSRGAWWVAYDGGTPVAFAGICPSVRWSDTGYLCRAGVLEQARGQGLQKKLIAKRLAYARRMGWAYAITDTFHNPASANSLIAAGFTMYQPRDPWGLRGAQYWRKSL